MILDTLSCEYHFSVNKKLQIEDILNCFGVSGDYFFLKYFLSQQDTWTYVFPARRPAGDVLFADK